MQCTVQRTTTLYTQSVAVGTLASPYSKILLTMFKLNWPSIQILNLNPGVSYIHHINIIRLSQNHDVSIRFY